MASRVSSLVKRFSYLSRPILEKPRGLRRFSYSNGSRRTHDDDDDYYGRRRGRGFEENPPNPIPNRPLRKSRTRSDRDGNRDDYEKKLTRDRVLEDGLLDDFKRGDALSGKSRNNLMGKSRVENNVYEREKRGMKGSNPTIRDGFSNKFDGSGKMEEKVKKSRSEDGLEDEFLDKFKLGDEKGGNFKNPWMESDDDDGLENPILGEERGIRGTNRSINDGFSNKIGDEGNVGVKVKKSRGDHGLDSEFLDKFKLGDKKNENLDRNVGTQLPHHPEEETEASEEVIEPHIAADADDIFKKMKETGLIPNAVAMLDGLCKDGLVQEAMKLFGVMREKGTIPEVVIYTAVVDGFCKAHKFDDAKRIFRKMEINGISPNAFSYTVLVQGLYKRKRLEDALDFCEEMLEAGHSPNVVTFVGLVDGFCSEKGVEEAKGVIERLRGKRFFVDEKAVREYLDKRGPFVPLVWEAIFGKKACVIA